MCTKMMDENDEFIIVFHLEEGSGLNFKCSQICVTASLGGNKLETEIVPVGQSTQFNSNLIWETDKKSIKKMKTENLPIKVECFSVTHTNGQEVRNMIGYILVPIRGIPIVPQKKAINAKSHWYKLVGLNSEWRIQKPELLLFVTITDKCNLDEDGGLLHVQNTTMAGLESIPIEPCNTADMLTSQSGLYIKLLQDEGLLQVGNMENDCDIFILKLMFKNARHLEHIVNPEEQMNQLFRFHYNLLGSPTHCSLIPKGNGLFSIQEKIAIHFRTSLGSLNEYFRRVLYIPIDLYYNDTIVGHARFTFTNLLKTENLHEFVAIYGDNDNTMERDGTFMIETLFDLPPTAMKPYVEFVFGLKYLSTTKVSNCEIIVDKPQIAEFIDNQAGGDVCIQHTLELPPTDDLETRFQVAKDHDPEPRGARSDTELITAREGNLRTVRGKQPKQTRSEPMIAINTDKTDIDTLLMEKNESRPSKTLPRTFSFNLMLQTVKFTRRPEIGIWQISLHHPKSDTTFTIANVELTEICSNLIEFKDLELQLFFSSSPDEILDLIECEPCVLTINGPRGIHATADLDNEILLVGTKEKRSGVILMEDQNGEKMAMAHIFVYLDDLGLSFNSQVKRLSSLTQQPRAYMDENLAYKIVEELEEWKLKQQEVFLVELKRKEINHMAHLTAEWKRKKSEQEKNLAEKLDQCSLLKAALEEAHSTLQEKGVYQLEQERVINQTKTELEQNYAARLVELREKAQQIEDDMAHQLKLQELKYRELEMTKNLVAHENENLKQENEELEAKIKEMKLSFLPREQLAGLFQDMRILSERLDEVQKSKNFYKDQWAKIIREMHKMKTENLHQMEVQLKKSRSVGLKEFLSSEHKDLVSEREELDFIKEALCSDCESDDEQAETVREDR